MTEKKTPFFWGGGGEAGSRVDPRSDCTFYAIYGLDLKTAIENSGTGVKQSYGKRDISELLTRVDWGKDQGYVTYMVIWLCNTIFTTSSNSNITSTAAATITSSNVKSPSPSHPQPPQLLLTPTTITSTTSTRSSTTITISTSPAKTATSHKNKAMMMMMMMVVAVVVVVVVLEMVNFKLSILH